MREAGCRTEVTDVLRCPLPLEGGGGGVKQPSSVLEYEGKCVFLLNFTYNTPGNAKSDKDSNVYFKHLYTSALPNSGLLLRNRRRSAPI